MKFFTHLMVLIFISIQVSSQETSTLYPMQKKYKWGFINKKGEWIIAPKYPHAKHFHEGLAIARKPGINQWGYLNKEGEWAIKPHFGKKRTAHRIYAGKRWYDPSIDPFQNGKAPVLNNDTISVINKKGEILKKLPQYSALRGFHEGRAAFKKDEKWGFLNKNWEATISPQYEEVGNFHDGLAFFQEDFSAPYGFINKNGEVKIEAQFDRVGHFNNGLAPAKADAFEPYGYINKKGEWVIEPQFEKASPFSEGLAFVSTKNWKGYINRSGEVALKSPVEGLKICHGHPFHKDLALVSVLEKDSSCNRVFSVVLPYKKASNSAYAYINKSGEIIYQQPLQYGKHLKKLEDSIERAEKMAEKRRAKAEKKREKERLADCKDFKAYGSKSDGSYLELGYRGVRRRFYYSRDVFQKKAEDDYQYHLPPFQNASGETFLNISQVGLEPSFFDESKLEADDLSYVSMIRGEGCLNFPSNATDDGEISQVKKKQNSNLWKKGQIKYTNPDDSQNYILLNLEPDKYKMPADEEEGNSNSISGFMQHDGEKMTLDAEDKLSFKYFPYQEKLEISIQNRKESKGGGVHISATGSNIQDFEGSAGKFFNEAVHRFDDHYIEYFHILAFSENKVHIKHYRKQLSEEDEHKEINKDQLSFSKKYLVGNYKGPGYIKAVDLKPVKYPVSD